MNVTKSAAWIVIASMLVVGCASAATQLRVKDVGPATRPDAVELRGLAAGAFDASLWQLGKLNLVRDVRFPLIEPKIGDFRNIYAPSVVKTDAGWAIFYGAWDGTNTGNDRVYRGDADADFLEIAHRHTVIEHNVFQHVCNVNVTRDETGAWAMMATALPDANGWNKPITFFSKDGEHWNGRQVPHDATRGELVTVAGYDKYAQADVNGMNVLLRDDGKWRMYFGDFHNFGKTFRATSDDAKHFTLDGPVLEGNYAINDVKKVKSTDGTTWFLAGLHMNGDRLYYSLSQDGARFPKPKTLIEHAGDADRFIVAIGFVVDGDRVLGALYGAGAVGSLDHNRIFAVWLQKRVELQVNGKAVEPIGALGPDRTLFHLDTPARVSLLHFSDDGETVVGSTNALLKPGRVYEVKW